VFRLLIKLGRWLDKRFPEKVVLTRAEIDALILRITAVEQNAVHKGAVSDLVLIVKQVKDEFASLKTSLGMNRVGNDDIEAMLNGTPITGDTTNG
jgi:hypothetical protein